MQQAGTGTLGVGLERGEARCRSRRFDGVAALVIGLAVSLHIAALTSLELGFLNPFFNDAENRLGRGADFFAVYQAGHNFLSGVSVYTPGAEAVPYAYPFRYLPFMAVLPGAIANLLPPWPAYWGWVAFVEALLAINVLLTWRFAPDRRTAVAGATMWLLFTPFYLELFMGQFSFVMATLFFWLGLGLHLDRRLHSLTAWTVSVLTKGMSLLFLPLLWKQGWSKLAIAALAVLAALNLPYFLLVRGSWETWSSNFRSVEGETAFDPHAGNLGLASLMHLPETYGGGTALETGLTWLTGTPWPLLFLLVAGAVTLLASRRQPLRLLALWTCTYFLVFGEVWEHHYVMLLPVLVLLVLFDDTLRVPAFVAYVFVALPTPYALFQTSVPTLDYHLYDPQAYWSSIEVYAQHLSKVVPTLLLWLLLSVHLAKGDKASVTANAKVTLRHAGSRLRHTSFVAR